MCRRVTCKKCAKPTYQGCGQHVEQVLAGVPTDQRCACVSSPGPFVRGLRRLLGRA